MDCLGGRRQSQRGTGERKIVPLKKPDSSGSSREMDYSSSCHRLLIRTNIGTGFIIKIVSTASVRELKDLIAQEHTSAFPEFGKIVIKSLKYFEENYPFHMLDAFSLTNYIPMKATLHATVEEHAMRLSPLRNRAVLSGTPLPPQAVLVENPVQSADGIHGDGRAIGRSLQNLDVNEVWPHSRQDFELEENNDLEKNMAGSKGTSAVPIRVLQSDPGKDVGVVALEAADAGLSGLAGSSVLEPGSRPFNFTADLARNKNLFVEKSKLNTVVAAGQALNGGDSNKNDDQSMSPRKGQTFGLAQGGEVQLPEVMRGSNHKILGVDGETRNEEFVNVLAPEEPEIGRRMDEDTLSEDEGKLPGGIIDWDKLRRGDAPAVGRSPDQIREEHIVKARSTDVAEGKLKLSPLVLGIDQASLRLDENQLRGGLDSFQGKGDIAGLVEHSQMAVNSASTATASIVRNLTVPLVETNAVIMEQASDMKVITGDTNGNENGSTESSTDSEGESENDEDKVKDNEARSGSPTVQRNAVQVRENSLGSEQAGSRIPQQDDTFGVKGNRANDEAVTGEDESEEVESEEEEEEEKDEDEDDSSEEEDSPDDEDEDQEDLEQGVAHQQGAVMIAARTTAVPGLQQVRNKLDENKPKTGSAVQQIPSEAGEPILQSYSLKEPMQTKTNGKGLAEKPQLTGVTLQGHADENDVDDDSNVSSTEEESSKRESPEAEEEDSSEEEEVEETSSSGSESEEEAQKEVSGTPKPPLEGPVKVSTNSAVSARPSLLGGTVPIPFPLKAGEQGLQGGSGFKPSLNKSSAATISQDFSRPGALRKILSNLDRSKSAKAHAGAGSTELVNESFRRQQGPASSQMGGSLSASLAATAAAPSPKPVAQPAGLDEDVNMVGTLASIEAAISRATAGLAMQKTANQNEKSGTQKLPPSSGMPHGTAAAPPGAISPGTGRLSDDEDDTNFRMMETQESQAHPMAGVRMVDPDSERAAGLNAVRKKAKAAEVEVGKGASAKVQKVPDDGGGAGRKAKDKAKSKAKAGERRLSMAGGGKALAEAGTPLLVGGAAKGKAPAGHKEAPDGSQANKAAPDGGPGLKAGDPSAPSAGKGKGREGRPKESPMQPPKPNKTGDKVGKKGAEAVVGGPGSHPTREGEARVPSQGKGSGPADVSRRAPKDFSAFEINDSGAEEARESAPKVKKRKKLQIDGEASEKVLKKKAKSLEEVEGNQDAAPTPSKGIKNGLSAGKQVRHSDAARVVGVPKSGQPKKGHDTKNAPAGRDDVDVGAGMELPTESPVDSTPSKGTEGLNAGNQKQQKAALHKATDASNAGAPGGTVHAIPGTPGSLSAKKRPKETNVEGGSDVQKVSKKPREKTMACPLGCGRKYVGKTHAFVLHVKEAKCIGA